MYSKELKKEISKYIKKYKLKCKVDELKNFVGTSDSFTFWNNLTYENLSEDLVIKSSNNSKKTNNIFCYRKAKNKNERLYQGII